MTNQCFYVTFKHFLTCDTNIRVRIVLVLASHVLETPFISNHVTSPGYLTCYPHCNGLWTHDNCIYWHHFSPHFSVLHLLFFNFMWLELNPKLKCCIIAFIIGPEQWYCGAMNLVWNCNTNNTTTQYVNITLQHNITTVKFSYNPSTATENSSNSI